MRVILCFLFLSSISGCIGTDIVDYPLGAAPSYAEIAEGSISLSATESYALNFRLVANDGSTIPAEWQWSSRNDQIAAVDQNGMVTGVSKGQTWIDGIAMMEFRDSVLVNVTSDPNDVASVIIEGDNSNMSVGETRQLSVEVRNASGDVVSVPVTWSSSNDDVISVDAGAVSANKEGSASITARADDILSEPFVIEVGEESGPRMGDFSGRNGYNASGTATLEVNGDQAILKFSSDFTCQNGPGLYIYLSPVSNGVTGGLNLGMIKSTSGAQEYELPDGSNPELYDHVIIYCQPFGVLFGAASFE